MTQGTFALLTRHFARAILSPPLLTDLGVDYLRRTLSSVFAVLIVVMLFLPRALFRRYASLTLLSQAEDFQRALQADTLMVIAIPMVMVALVAVVMAPLLFPDETDYRVLTPLPIARWPLFAAKLCALALVAIAVVLVVNIVTSVWFPIATGGRRATHALPARMAAHAVASIAGSIWIFLAVMAVQGLTLVAIPRAWQRRLALLLQAVLFVALLWSLPIVIRMPAMTVDAGVVMQAPLVWLPPAWFLGVERWLLDGPASGGYADAAGVAAWACAAAVAAVIGFYAILYRTAERLAGVGGANRRASPGRFRIVERLERAGRLGPAEAAIVSFITSGLMRSRFHQFVFLIIAGAGVAIVIGDWLTVMTATSGRMARPSAAATAAIAAPLLVALVCTLGLRAVFLWPLDRRAAWVFRLTEDPRWRGDALNGVHTAFVAGVTVGPWVVAAVLQPSVLGGAWWLAAILTTLAGLALVEVVLIDWRRIPFACSYLPGKKNLAYMIGALSAAYFAFVLIGSNLIRWCIADANRTVAAAGVLLAWWAVARRARTRTWGATPLEFEDSDPLAVQPLNLSPDERS